jgi:hypothetical protein
MKITGMLYIKGLNFDKYRQFCIKQFKENPKENHNFLMLCQKAYAKENSCPLFCREKVTGSDEPTSLFMYEKYGVEKAIRKMCYELVTGCPKTGYTWCD